LRSHSARRAPRRLRRYWNSGGKASCRARAHKGRAPVLRCSDSISGEQRVGIANRRRETTASRGSTTARCCGVLRGRAGDLDQRAARLAPRRRASRPDARRQRFEPPSTPRGAGYTGSRAGWRLRIGGSPARDGPAQRPGCGRSVSSTRAVTRAEARASSQDPRRAASVGPDRGACHRPNTAGQRRPADQTRLVRGGPRSRERSPSRSRAATSCAQVVVHEGTGSAVAERRDGVGRRAPPGGGYAREVDHRRAGVDPLEVDLAVVLRHRALGRLPTRSRLGLRSISSASHSIGSGGPVTRRASARRRRCDGDSSAP